MDSNTSNSNTGNYILGKVLPCRLPLLCTNLYPISLKLLVNKRKYKVTGATYIGYIKKTFLITLGIKHNLLFFAAFPRQEEPLLQSGGARRPQGVCLRQQSTESQTTQYETGKTHVMWPSHLSVTHTER